MGGNDRLHGMLNEAAACAAVAGFGSPLHLHDVSSSQCTALHNNTEQCLLSFRSLKLGCLPIFEPPVKSCADERSAFFCVYMFELAAEKADWALGISDFTIIVRK